MLIMNVLKNNIDELWQQNFGNEIDVNEEHFDKHCCLMNITEFGMVKFLEFLKQLFGKQCTIRIISSS